MEKPSRWLTNARKDQNPTQAKTELYFKMLCEGRDTEFELMQVSKVPLEPDFSLLVFHFKFLFRKLF